jgi:hypothetical protein
MNSQTKCPKCGLNRLPAPINTLNFGGQEMSLFKGYVDKSLLKALSFDDKITYLRARAILIFLDPLEEILYLEKENALAKFHLLNLMTIICCAIEGLGHYLTGKVGFRTARPAFEKFVKEFMNPDFQKVHNGKTYSRILWEYFRNGLAHGFVIEKGGIERKLSGYFNVDPKIGLEIDVDLFVSDFKKGFEDFFKKLQSEGDNSGLGNNFKKIFQKRLCE